MKTMPNWPVSSESFFFCQAENGIRVPLVTGVQTCALPISPTTVESSTGATTRNDCEVFPSRLTHANAAAAAARDNANRHRFIGPKCKGSRSPVTRSSGPLSSGPLWNTDGGRLLRDLLEHRHREERPQVVVGDAQPGRQQPHH